VSIEANSPPVLRAHIDADGTSSKHSADVVAVVALDHAESQVLHGENGGSVSPHASVALDLIRIGKLERESLQPGLSNQIKSGVDTKNLRLIVFLQESGPGAVLGAALREVGNSNQLRHLFRAGKLGGQAFLLLRSKTLADSQRRR